MTEISEMIDKNRKLEVTGSIGMKMMYTRKERKEGNVLGNSMQINKIKERPVLPTTLESGKI